MADLTLTIATVDRTAYLQRMPHARKTNTGISRQVDFRLKGFTPAIGDAVTLANAAGTLSYSGNVRSLRVSEWTPGQYFCDVTAMESGSYGSGPCPFALSDGQSTVEEIYTGMVADLATTMSLRNWWRLGEASGTTATDEQAALNLTYDGSPTLGAAGPYGTNTAMTVTGTEFAYANSSPLASYAYKGMSLWFKTTYKTALTTLYSERYSGGGTEKFRLQMTTNGYLSFDVQGSTGTADNLTLAQDLADGNWHHVVVFAYHAGALHMRVDGNNWVTELPVATFSNSFPTMDRVRVGAEVGSSSYNFRGSFDEVQVWSGAAAYGAIEELSYRLSGLTDVREYVSLGRLAVSDGTTLTETYTVDTYEIAGTWPTGASHGLFPGMWVNVTSDNLGLVGEALEIKEIDLSYPDNKTPRLTLTLGDTPVRLAAAFP